MDDIRRAFDMCNHTRCAAAREEWISYRMPYSGIYRCRRQYRILPEAKYIEKSTPNYNLACKNVTGLYPGVPENAPARCAIVRGRSPPNNNLSIFWL